MHALLIHNPISGQPERHDALQRAIGELHAGGWRLDIRPTERKGHARELAEQAVRAGYSEIIIAGGDGSMGQAADGIVTELVESRMVFGKRVRIEAEIPQPVHLDGDPIGFSPFTVEIMPCRLPVYLDRRRAAPRLL